MTPICIESAGLADVLSVARVHLRSALRGYEAIFPDDAPKPTEDDLRSEWAERIASGSDLERTFVARAATEVLGVVRAGPDPLEPSVGHLSSLYVEPAAWGLGIGTLLYAAAVDHLRSGQFPSATLWVLERNTRARSWHERLGWIPTGSTAAVYPPGCVVDIQYRLLSIDADA